MQPSTAFLSSPGRSKSSLRILLIGCLGLACILCSILTILGVRSIVGDPTYASFSKNAQIVATEMPNLAALREQLLSDYPSEDIGTQVTWRQRVGSSDTVFGLAITIKNPTFPVPSDSTQWRTFARRIATEVAATYPQVNRFDFISITFANVHGVGITLSTAATYVFPVDEVLP
jgi:hypothetical protein